MKKQGDVSRRRRLAGPDAKLRWYARYRAERFARRYWARAESPADRSEPAALCRQAA